VIEVFLISTVSGVVSLAVNTEIIKEGWLRDCLSSEYENGREEEK
jgi:hypothetical protein